MLGGVIGRKAGAVPGYRYSPALKSASFVWSADNLDRWLTNPQQFVPGAKMPIRVLERTSRRDIIAYLQQESGGRIKTTDDRRIGILAVADGLAFGVLMRAGQLGDPLDVRNSNLRAAGLGEKIECLVVVVADRRERTIGVVRRIGIACYCNLQQDEPPDGADQDRVFAEGLPRKARPENPGILARQAGPPLRRAFEAEDAALQRVYVFEGDRRRERGEHL